MRHAQGSTRTTKVPSPVLGDGCRTKPLPAGGRAADSDVAGVASGGTARHVGPINPVIHGVKPEFRLLPGLAAQFPPQSGDIRNELDPRPRLRFIRRLVIGRSCRFRLRSGNFFQAVLPSYGVNTFSAGSLRSTSVTRFPRYYEPLRLPDQPHHGYVFPRCVEGVPHWIAVTEMGLSGSCTDLSMPAALYHPEEPRRCIYSLLHGGRRASPAPDRMATLKQFNGAVTGSLALRLAPSHSKAPTKESLPLPLGQLHGERVISMFSSFQLNRSVRLCLTHRRKQRLKWKSPFRLFGSVQILKTTDVVLYVEFT